MIMLMYYFYFNDDLVLLIVLKAFYNRSSRIISAPKITEAIPLFVKKARFIFDRSSGFTKRCWFIRSPMNRVVAVQNKVEVVK